MTLAPVSVYAGNVLVGEISPSSSGTVVFSIPAGCADANGLLEISLNVEQTVVPGGGNDNRELGIMISRIKMERVGTEHDT